MLENVQMYATRWTEVLYSLQADADWSNHLCITILPSPLQKNETNRSCETQVHFPVPHPYENLISFALQLVKVHPFRSITCGQTVTTEHETDRHWSSSNDNIVFVCV